MPGEDRKPWPNCVCGPYGTFKKISNILQLYLVHSMSNGILCTWARISLFWLMPTVAFLLKKKKIVQTQGAVLSHPAIL